MGRSSPRPALPTDAPRREATAEELKAMAHPLRLRILRLCLHDSLTNKEIAGRLGRDPATTLHHVRTLCRTGFLAAEPPRTGRRGALEKPYRATGKSWILSVGDHEEEVTAVLAGLDALRDELTAAGRDSIIENTRLGLRLAPEEIEELGERLDALVREYAGRPPTAGGANVGLHVTLHRLAEHG